MGLHTFLVASLLLQVQVQVSQVLQVHQVRADGWTTLDPAPYRRQGKLVRI